MKIDEFQNLIEDIYFERDKRRGILGTFVWFVEEVGELGKAIRTGDRENLTEEFADVFAWLSTLASISNIRLTNAIKKYQHGCPSCNEIPCTCETKE